MILVCRNDGSLRGYNMNLTSNSSKKSMILGLQRNSCRQYSLKLTFIDIVLLTKVSGHSLALLSIYAIFMFKKISISTCSGWRRVRNLLTISPAAEKTHSDGTDVAGTPKIACTIFK